VQPDKQQTVTTSQRSCPTYTVLLIPQALYDKQHQWSLHLLHVLMDSHSLSNKVEEWIQQCCKTLQILMVVGGEASIFYCECCTLAAPRVQIKQTGP